MISASRAGSLPSFGWKSTSTPRSRKICTAASESSSEMSTFGIGRSFVVRLQDWQATSLTRGVIEAPGFLRGTATVLSSSRTTRRRRSRDGADAIREHAQERSDETHPARAGRRRLRPRPRRPGGGADGAGPDRGRPVGRQLLRRRRGRPRGAHRPPAERAPGEERHPLRRRRHVDPDGHRRAHPRRPAEGRRRREQPPRLRDAAAARRAGQDLHPRRPGRRQRPDRDRDGRRASSRTTARSASPRRS